VVSYKISARATTAISIQHFKIICSADPKTDMLKVDKDAILGGKSIPSAQRRRIILVYKTTMHPEAHLNSALCGVKANPRTMNTCLIGTLRQLDQYLSTTSPPTCSTKDTEMEEAIEDYNQNITIQETTREQRQQPPQDDRGTQPSVEDHRAIVKELPFTSAGRRTTSATHPRFDTPKPPKVPLKTRIGPLAVNLTNIAALNNIFSPLGENVNVSRGKYIEVLSSGILRGGS